jgi:hypothetical protein
MGQQALGVVRMDRMPHHHAIVMFEDLCKEVALGVTKLDYDPWLVARLRARDHGAVQYVSKGIVFALEHCSRYEIDATHFRRRRVFDCMLDATFPFFAFIDAMSGKRGPWVSGISLFTAPELRTLWKMATPTFGGKVAGSEENSDGFQQRFSLSLSNALDYRETRG